ncbi:hypothetical protein [uncultured Megasphaera sp.]|uniref:hypothetical protein n=1 Tax=uncultured Megasphaera sp. TaxID=165188 RepID=UPI00259327A2|nr:hypothetical protein [uncultured Megasphaera sp.]
MENMTKLLTELTIDENEIPKKTVRKEKAVTSKKSNLEIAISQFNEWVIAGSRKIVSAFDKKINSENSWISLTNGTVYVPAIVSLIPRIDKFDFVDWMNEMDMGKRKFFFNGYKGDYPTFVEAHKIFQSQQSGLGRNRDGFIDNGSGQFYGIVSNIIDEIAAYDIRSGGRMEFFSWLGNIDHKNHLSMKRFNRRYTDTTILPIHRLSTKNCPKISSAKTVYLFAKQKFQPENIPLNQELKIYHDLQTLAAYGVLTYEKDYLAIDSDKVAHYILEVRREYDGLKEMVKANSKAPLTNTYAKETEFSEETVTDAEALRTELLECDYHRAMLDKYDAKLLTDPKRGHWDLWDWDNSHKDGVSVKLPERWVARDPEADINHGIVAIDFGTKSTVVVYENEQLQHLPLQVGNGNYGKGVEEANYENPTVIQFLDLQSFIKAYNARAGRPYTSWNDVTVSHTAFQNMNNNSSELYYSFLTDLKQWCGSGQGLLLCDQKGYLQELPPYVELTDEDADPLAYYAYYLGLYINNMLSEKHLFMHYIMSFPVTYEKENREKMRHSFEAGLKKSLPTALLSNPDAMKHFLVEEGASEPAAYAITALQEYGFDPCGDEKNYYAVFDFGGGTTDFDFGVYQEADSDRYDYKLVHFGENGDRTLGGENILRLLAFRVFCHNQQKLLNPRIPFTWAADKFEFRGSEAFIKDSREAHANMHNLMEALRPVWENPDGEEAKSLLENGEVAFNVFQEDGTMIPNFSLSLKGEDEAAPLDLERIIQDRILKGIENFFVAMKEAFANYSEEDGIDPLEKIDSISVFLGGNSSKSKRVTTLFQEVIAEKEEGTPTFTIYPTLGSPEALERQEAIWRENPALRPDELIRPTGKTGVAYGLLACRNSGNVQVITLQPDSRRTGFQFYVGRNKKRRFHPVIDRNTSFDTWHYFIDASNDFDLLYTKVPEAATGKAPVTIAKQIHVSLEKPEPEANVYIRPVSTDTIVYIVAKSLEEAQKERFLAKPVTIQLI